MKTPAVTVASTILEQLGGRRFAAMTGVKSFCDDGDGLIFKVPNARAPNGKRVNYVHIKLNTSDLYDVIFSSVTMKSLTQEARVEGVYAENLQEVFTANTGLHTHL